LLIFSLSFINLGSPERELSTKPPKPTSSLPIDEPIWDQGVSFIHLLQSLPVSQPPQVFAPNHVLQLSCPSSTEMCQFARLAQAANLLNFVYDHISDKTYQPMFREEEAMQLDRTLHSLIELAEVEVLNREKLRSCAGMSLCRRYFLCCHSTRACN
jgi:hypothetical protein